MTTLRLQEMRWPEVRQYLAEKQIILIPVGATEQHGTHLPLGTDTYESVGWAEEVARRTGTVVAPPLWFGWSSHHMCHPGTITVAAQTLIQMVCDIGVSLVYHGFTKLVIVNGHRETNLAPLKIAATRITSETHARVIVVDPGYMGGNVGREMRQVATGGVGHADELETSLILHLHGEDWVDTEQAKDRTIPRPAGANPVVEQDRPYKPLVLDELRALTSPTGALGDPSGASAEKGARYLEALVESLITVIEELRSEIVTTVRPSLPI